MSKYTPYFIIVSFPLIAIALIAVSIPLIEASESPPVGPTRPISPELSSSTSEPAPPAVASPVPSQTVVVTATATPTPTATPTATVVVTEVPTPIATTVVVVTPVPTVAPPPPPPPPTAEPPVHREPEPTGGVAEAIAHFFPEQIAKATRVAQCESGLNPHNKQHPDFRGLWQFSWGTWQAYGGTGDPADASAWEQTMRARMLYDAVGWATTASWPVCGHR
jgi:hypothetical protein